MDAKEVYPDRLERIFFSFTQKRVDEAIASGGRFVYYTTGEVAVSILRNKEIWLRKAQVMNDFSEITHGFECLNSAYKDEPGKKLKSSLESCFPGLPEEVEGLFNAWLPSMREDTYITCVSEHRADEDLVGRLSMWRAYGRSTGVALIVKGDVMLSNSTALGAYSSPVSYSDETQFAKEFTQIAERVKAECEYLKRLEREVVKNAVFTMFRAAMPCTKHPAFHEELEWRIIASPKMHPSPRLISTVEVVRGVPQNVIKIKLENSPNDGLVLSVPDLLDRIIIGPCEFPLVVFRAFCQLLQDLNVPDPETKVIISAIPLRNI
jgi:Protein of unknown function (DUF2971)